MRKRWGVAMLLTMETHGAVRRQAGGGWSGSTRVVSLALGMAAGAVLALLARVGGVLPPRLEARLAAAPLPAPGLDLAWDGAPVSSAQLQAQDMDRLVTLVGAGVALLLLVAAVNLVVAAASRAVERRHDMAVRYAMGPSRWRMAAPLLVEGLMAAVLGAAVAAAFLAVALPALLLTAPAAWTAAPGMALGLLVLAAPMLLAVLLSILPALDVWTLPTWSRLVTGDRATAAPGTRLTWSLLLGTQTACAVGTLFGASLLVAAAGAADAGSGASPADVVLLRARGSDTAAVAAALPGLLTGLADTPGVATAGVGSAGAVLGVGPEHRVLTECMCSMGTMFVQLWMEDPVHHAVTPGFFDALGLAVAEGRGISAADGPASEPVVVVNRAFADARSLGTEPLGKHIQLQQRTLGAPWYRVVGIVDNVYHPGPGTGIAARPALYLAAAQHAPREAVIVVRLSAPDAADWTALRNRAAALAPALEIDAPEGLPGALDRFAAPVRWLGMVLVVLGLLAGGLAALGAFSVSRDLVLQRRRELGVRLALGATPGRVARTVLAGIVRPLAAGVGFGAVAAWSVGRGLGAHAGGPLLGLAAALAVLVLAGAVPALADLRRLDPAVLLRQP